MPCDDLLKSAAHSRYSNCIICGDGTDRMTEGFVADLYSLVSTAGILAVLADFVTAYADKAKHIHDIGIEALAVSSIIPIDWHCDRQCRSTTALAQTRANWIIGIRNITQDAVPMACLHPVKFVRMHHTAPS
jgi:hypothetical protein